MSENFRPKDEVVTDLWSYILDLTERQLREEGHRPDVISAVINKDRNNVNS